MRSGRPARPGRADVPSAQEIRVGSRQNKRDGRAVKAGAVTMKPCAVRRVRTVSAPGRRRADGVRLEVLPELSKRTPEHRAETPATRGTARASRRRRSQTRQGLSSIASREIFVKVRPVDVDDISGRPVHQAAARPIERCEPVGRGSLIEHHAEVARRHASFVGGYALLIRREALDLPLRKECVRLKHREPSEHAPQAADPAA